jgi:hypothetical protein
VSTFNFYLILRVRLKFGLKFWMSALDLDMLIPEMDTKSSLVSDDQRKLLYRHLPPRIQVSISAPAANITERYRVSPYSEVTIVQTGFPIAPGLPFSFLCLHVFLLHVAMSPCRRVLVSPSMSPCPHVLMFPCLYVSGIPPTENGTNGKRKLPFVFSANGKRKRLPFFLLQIKTGNGRLFSLVRKQ